jgi:hypothetical protein
VGIRRAVDAFAVISRGQGQMIRAAIGVGAAALVLIAVAPSGAVDARQLSPQTKKPGPLSRPGFYV